VQVETTGVEQHQHVAGEHARAHGAHAIVPAETVLEVERQRRLLPQPGHAQAGAATHGAGHDHDDAGHVPMTTP
jgi:hypothetical protein